jgi:autotransporter-associated beta strand protein
LQFAAAFDPSIRTMTFQAGGATLDTQTYNVTFADSIGNGGAGGLTKKGSGTLTLNALANYGGNTTVNKGTLIFAGGIVAGGTSLIDVQSGTAVLNTVGVNKTNLNIITAAGATFEIADSAHAVGAISGSGITKVDAGASLSAASIVQGTLTIGSGGIVTIRAITQTHTWDGGGADNLWTTKENWVDDAAPDPSDNIILPAVAARLENVDNFASDVLFGSITISGSGYDVQGNALKCSLLTVQPDVIFQVNAIIANQLTIGSGATVVIRPISGGPQGGEITPVPEPNAIILLGAAIVALSSAWVWKTQR